MADEPVAQPPETPAVEVKTEVKSESKVDFEAKCREMQAENDKLKQDYERLNSEYESVKPFVNFGSESPKSEPVNEDDELPITKKEHRETISAINRQHQIERLTDRFLGANPDLASYQDIIATKVMNMGGILRSKGFSQEKIAASIPELLGRAAKEVRTMLDTERQKGEQAATEKASQKAKEVAAASGLESSGTTSPKEPVESKGESTEDYLKRRNAQRYGMSL